MKKLTILVDMDDTLIKLGETWIEFLNERYGTNVDWRDVTDWDVSIFFPELTRYQVFEPLHSAELWKRTKPMDGAVEAVAKLRKDGHRVIVVTSAPPKTVEAKLIYSLFKHFRFTYKDVIIAYHKQLIKGDVLVDDAPHNLAGGNYLPILVDAPHNRDYDAEYNGMIRTENWEQIYDVITEFAKLTEEFDKEEY